MIRFNLIEKIKLIFNIKVSNKKAVDSRRAGVLVEGKNSIFVNCKGVGPDAGMIDKGKGTKIINSEWIATGKK